MAYSLYVGRPMEDMPTRHEIAARLRGCATSESGYRVCISTPNPQVVEGAVSFSRFGPYMHDYYMVDVMDRRGKMTLELRREWGLTGFFKNYSISLWDGARHLIASVDGDWDVVTGDRKALSMALSALCQTWLRDDPEARRLP